MNFTFVFFADCNSHKTESHIYSVHQFVFGNIEQEAQLMLTNPRDAFRGQSRSPNMVPFDMLGVFSY